MRCAGGTHPLDLAVQRAQTLDLAHAALAWRTIRGQETSACRPAGTARVPSQADIALTAVRYAQSICDKDFARGSTLPLLAQTAPLGAVTGICR